MTHEEAVAQCQAYWHRRLMDEMCAVRDELYGKPVRGDDVYKSSAHKSD